MRETSHSCEADKMPCPKAVCYTCGNRYSGWSLMQRGKCDCGGKLYVGFPYNVIIGWVRAGNQAITWPGGVPSHSATRRHKVGERDEPEGGT